MLLPTLNERAYIRDCLDSLLAQDYEDVCEILVIDGGSKDGTREIVATEGGLVRLVDNPRVTAAAAMNVGLAEAKGDLVCRADAHTLYAPDYIRRCVEVLLETDAANVGGPMRPVGTTSFGRAVAAVTTSAFGVGPAKFHLGGKRSEVDTVYLGFWRRETLESVGGYDEATLQWAAEDQELNFRIRKAGGRVLMDPAIRSWYFPRDNPRALGRQYFNYGVCKASTLLKHKSLPSLRPLAPAALVAVSAVGFVAGRRWWRLAVPVAHAVATATVSLQLGDNPGVAPHRAAGAIEVCHWAYGAGFWAGLWRAVTGRRFDTRPRGHR